MLPYIIACLVILAIIGTVLNGIVQLIELWNGDLGTDHDVGLHDNHSEFENDHE